MSEQTFFPVFFLFLSEVFQDHYRTDLTHVQLIMQDLSCRLFIHINHLTNHSNAQTSIFPNNFTDFLNIFFGFWCWRASRTIVVFHLPWPSMDRLCHSETRVRDRTLLPYAPFNSWKHSAGVYFQFHKKFQIDALLDFHPSHESGRATQHGHTQTKLRGKLNDIERRVRSCSIWEGSRSLTFHSLPTPTSFPGIVRAAPLLYSHTSYICDILVIKVMVLWLWRWWYFRNRGGAVLVVMTVASLFQWWYSVMKWMVFGGGFDCILVPSV
jgi:hypothetical protein